MRKWLWGLGSVLIGGMLFYWGFTAGNGEVTCGGQVMHPGDHCDHKQYGVVVSSKTYDQQKADNAQSGWIGLIAGPVIALGGVAGIFRAGRGARAPQPMPGQPLAGQPFQPNAAGMPGFGQAPYAPQPYQAQPPYPAQPPTGPGYYQR